MTPTLISRLPTSGTGSGLGGRSGGVLGITLQVDQEPIEGPFKLTLDGARYVTVDDAAALRIA